MKPGPVKLDNFYESVLHPEYEDIREKSQSQQSDINQGQVVSKMELNSKPNSPMIRYKSSENLIEKSDANAGPALNIEEVEQSEMQMINKNSKKNNNAQNGQVVLKAPCYRIEPRK